MDNQQILDEAPEGATHIEEATIRYIKVEEAKIGCGFEDWFIFDFDEGDWVLDDSYNVLLMRSLADIENIVGLEGTNDTLHELMRSGERRGIQKATEEFKDKLAELESKVRHLNQVIYNTAKVSFEAGACSINADFHESAEVFAKMMFKRNSE